MLLKFVSRLALALPLAATCSAQLPEYYKTVSRVTWVVENIDKVRPAWETLGLSDIQEYVNIELTGEYRGKPLTTWAWQITGRLGNLTVDMIQPAEGQRNVYTNFLSKHGDGIFSIVHEVQSRQELEKEIQRMKGKGVAVLQQVKSSRDQLPQYTYFDTEGSGKFVLGLAYSPRKAAPSAARAKVSHFGLVVWDAASVSAYWEKLGFPGFRMQPAAPREDAMYKGKPLSLAYEFGYQRYAQLPYEWISTPPAPANVFADFLTEHQREGIQHLGLPVENLPAAVATYEKLGYHVQQSGSRGDVEKPGSEQHVYLDTDSKGGIRIELVRSY